MLHKLDKLACHTRLSWTNLFKNKLVSIVTVRTFVSYEIPSVYWFLGLWVCGLRWFLFVGLWCMLYSNVDFWVCVSVYFHLWVCGVCWFLFVGLWCMLYSDVDFWVCGACWFMGLIVGVCRFLGFEFWWVYVDFWILVGVCWLFFYLSFEFWFV